MHHQQRLAVFFLERHRGDGAVVALPRWSRRIASAVSLRGTCRRTPRLRGRRGRTPDGSCPRREHPSRREQEHADRLRRPPLLEQLGLRPRLEHEARRGVEGSRDDQLASEIRSTVVRFFMGWDSLLFLRPLTFSFRFSSSTTLSSVVRSARPELRYRSIHAASSSSPRAPSLQVRTRPQ